VARQCSHHRCSSCSARTRVTPAQRVHQRQLLRHHLQQLFELQKPEAELMLTVGLDFGKHSKSQLRPPLAWSRRSATSSACHITYATCSQRMCAGCSMCVYADFQSALSPISPSLRSSCLRCSESMGERHWAHAWAQAVVGVLQSSRHLGRHCRVKHQQPPIAANSVHRAHPHLDSAPSKHVEGHHDGIPRVAGGATEPTQTPCGPFFRVHGQNYF
jgi:hypothetical protein